MLSVSGFVLLLLSASEEDLSRALFPPLREAGALARDGSDGREYDGEGEAQWEASWIFLKQKKEALARAKKKGDEIEAALKIPEDLKDPAQVARVKRELKELAGKPVDELRHELLDAVRAEKKRVQLVKKSMEVSRAAGAAGPPVDAELIDKLFRYLHSSQANQGAEARAGAYRSLAMGLVDYLDNDEVGALLKIKTAAENAPDIAAAHVYLGSLLYLTQKTEAAVLEWKKALELDPTNEGVKKALEAQGSQAP